VFEFSHEREWWEDRAGPGLDQAPTEEVVAHMHTLIQMLDKADLAAVDTATFDEKNWNESEINVVFASKLFTGVNNPLNVVTKRLDWLRCLHSPWEEEERKRRQSTEFYRNLRNTAYEEKKKKTATE
jgi:hypothetical protein